METLVGTVGKMFEKITRDSWPMYEKFSKDIWPNVLKFNRDIQLNVVKKLPQAVGQCMKK